MVLFQWEGLASPAAKKNELRRNIGGAYRVSDTVVGRLLSQLRGIHNISVTKRSGQTVLTLEYHRP